MVEGNTTEKTPLQKKKDELKIKNNELEKKERELKTAIRKALENAKPEKFQILKSKNYRTKRFMNIKLIQ